MTTATDTAATVREPALLGQTVLVIGGSAGIGRATAHLAHAEGAQVVLTGRDPQRLERVAADLGAHGYDAFDAHDPRSLEEFFRSLTLIIHRGCRVELRPGCRDLHLRF